MKNNIFLKISNFFNRFKTKDKSTDSDLEDFVDALQNNDPEKAHKAYDQHIMSSAIYYSAFSAIEKEDLNGFLSLAEKVPDNNKSKFYKKSINIAVSKDNAEIFKHILDNNHLTLNDINPDTLLHTLSNKNAYQIASIVLYDLNFQVTNKMKKMLTCDNEGKKHTQMLALIEKRELYSELGKNLEDIQPKAKAKAKVNKV